MNVLSLAPGGWRQHLRTVLSAGAVLLLVHLARAKDVFSDFTRPAVTFALHAFGIDAVDRGTTISVGRLEVPWTRDCAGLNLLLILIALTIWVNRSAPAGLSYWLKIAFTVPAALLANILRVLSLITYREVVYPAVESPQLHYFFGLVWLLPFVALVVPRGTRPVSHSLFEAMQAAAVVALLAPMSGVPGGDAITIAAILCLAHSRIQDDYPKLRAWLTVAWMFAAAGITLIGMESLWMPWLLLCPLLVSKAWIFSPAGIVLSVGTHPLFGMIPGGSSIIWIAVAYACWQWVRAAQPEDEAAARPSRPASLSLMGQLRPWAAAVFFVLPFIGSVLLGEKDELLVPPSSVATTSIASDAFDVRLPGQPENIGLVWFSPNGNGRHHSMKVCMKYRGVDLEPMQDCTDIFTDGTRMMREFYLQDGGLVTTYPDYIKRTFRPLSSPGAHLIFFTRREHMSADAFNEACQKLAVQMHALCEKEKQPGSDSEAYPAIAEAAGVR